MTEGEITITTDAGTVVLGPMDSAKIPPKRRRPFKNPPKNLPPILLIFPNEGWPMISETLKNPLSMFDVRGKSALITGASGPSGAAGHLLGSSA